MTATEFIAACAQLASAGRVFDFDSLPRYDALASAKKAEVGFDSLSQPCSESRRTPAVTAVFSFVPPVYGGSDGEPKGSPVPAGAARSVNPFEPPPLIDSHGGGCSKPQSLEANMAQSPASGANALAFQSTTFEVVDQQGQPWLRAREIAAALGYADEDAISRIYARRSDEFTDSMTCTVKLTVQGQDREVRIFSLRGAHLLAMFARTKIAKDFRRWVLDVLENEGAGVSALPTPYTVQPSDTLTEPQQIALRALLESNVKRLPHDKQAGAMVKGWSKLKAHFGVPYRQIPASEFTEAISIVARHVSEWGLVEDANKTPRPSYDDAVRTQAAFDAASQAAARVQSAVFNAVLSGNDEWKYSRWMLAFIDDSEKAAPAYVRQLEHGAFVTTWPRLVRDVGTGECMCTSPELIEMATACMQRLQQRPNTARLAA